MDKEFREIYEKIIGVFGYSEEIDMEARNLLYDILEKKSFYNIEEVFQKYYLLIKEANNIFILGGGPGSSSFLENVINVNAKIISEKEKNGPQDSLEYNEMIFNKITNKFKNYGINIFGKKNLLIAIDGCVNLLLNAKIIPNIIFTDLDGLTYEIATDVRLKESLFIIHAHGDNIDKIKKFKDFILEHANIIGTTQTYSKFPIINHGGFTDGDRALFFLKNILNDLQTIYLIGYEFGNIVGFHSKPAYKENTPANYTKQKKLIFGKKLTEMALSKIKSNIVIIESEYLNFLDIENISSEKRIIRKLSVN